MSDTATARHWWARPDLDYHDGELHLAGHSLQQLAAGQSTPLYCYSAERVRIRLEQLHAALAATGLAHRVYYAMKANRFAPLLTWLRGTGLCGIDACSPNEVDLALGCGFQPDEISFTAGSLSETDLDRLARQPGLIINADSLSTLRRLGRRCPGREIGLRINPGVGVGYGDNPLLQYAGRTTKFGIYREHLDEAIRVAAEHGLRITRLHLHVGIGYLTERLPLWEPAVKLACDFLDALPEVRLVNLGGGLGLPHTAADRPLDLGAWGGIIRRHLGPRGVTVAIEPGDFLVKDAGVLLLTVNSVERKREVEFVGVDGGFNLAVEPFFYQLPCEPVPARLAGADAWAPEKLRPVSIAGNINEALDVWAGNVPLPPLAEGDLLAFLNAGGYAASMSSNHCLRGDFRERLLFPPR